MDKNQKTVLLTLLGSIVFIVIVVFGYQKWKVDGVVHCPDGSSRPRMNADQFATQYSGYSGKLQGTLNEKNSFTAELGTQKVQEMSEAVQLARLHLQALAAGYDSCLVDIAEFNNSRDRYARMEDIARQVNDIGGHATLSISEQTRIKQLVEEYIRLSRAPSAEPKS